MKQEGSASCQTTWQAANASLGNVNGRHIACVDGCDESPAHQLAIGKDERRRGETSQVQDELRLTI